MPTCLLAPAPAAIRSPLAMRRRVLLAASALSLASMLSAGTVMTFEETQAGAAAPTGGTAWIETDRVKVQTGSDTVVFRADKQVLWAWSAGEKTYVELTKAQADEMGAAMKEIQAQMASMSPEERAMMQQVMGAQMGSLAGHVKGASATPTPVTFTPLGRTEAINGWKCVGLEARRGTEPAGEYWAASWDQFGITAADFAVFEKLMLFIREAAGPFASRMDATYAQAYGENGIPGVPVRVIESTPQGKRIHEIKKLSREDIAASTFELPAGLSKQALGAPGMR